MSAVDTAAVTPVRDRRVPSVFSVATLRQVRHRLTSAAGYAVLSLALLTATLHWPVAVWRLHVEIDGLRSKSSVERELRAAEYMGVDTRVFIVARNLIPKDGVYGVVVGRAESGDELAELDTVPRFAAWWLLPRRHTRIRSRADWLILYGVQPRAAGVDFERLVRIDEAIAVGKVRR